MNHIAIKIMQSRIQFLKKQIDQYSKEKHESEYQRGIDVGIAIGHRLEVDDLTRMINVLKGVEEDVSEPELGSLRNESRAAI